MTQIEYANKMTALVKEQTELKIAHMENLETMENEYNRKRNEMEAGYIAMKSATKAAYRTKQYELEAKKQQLKAEWTMEQELIINAN